MNKQPTGKAVFSPFDKTKGDRPRAAGETVLEVGATGIKVKSGF